MQVSIGIIAHNEEKTIGKLLDSVLSQTLSHVTIGEIIVVSSGCTDHTNKIVSTYTIRDSRIRLITQEKRVGKVSAINLFLQEASFPYYVLLSSDIILDKSCIEQLVNPFKDREVGIVASRPLPFLNSRGYIGSTTDLIWRLHHRISLSQPKFGEAIAFRSLISQLDDTAVDEEAIAQVILSQGYRAHYASQALVYNFPVATCNDFITQRRRIHCGHLCLQNKGHRASSLSLLTIASELIKEFSSTRWDNILVGCFLESYARLLGLFDYYIGKKHIVWERVATLSLPSENKA